MTFKNISKGVVPLALLCAASQIKSTVTPKLLPLLIPQLLLWYLAKLARETFSLHLLERYQNHSFSMQKTVLSGTVLYWKQKFYTQIVLLCLPKWNFTCKRVKMEYMSSSLHHLNKKEREGWGRNDNFVSSWTTYHTFWQVMLYESLSFLVWTGVTSRNWTS